METAAINVCIMIYPDAETMCSSERTIVLKMTFADAKIIIAMILSTLPVIRSIIHCVQADIKTVIREKRNNNKFKEKISLL